MARRRRTKQTTGSIGCVILLLVIFAMLSNCGRKMTKPEPMISRTPIINIADDHEGTRWMRHTEVQETIEREKILSSMTAIVWQTVVKTEQYLATENSIRSQQETQAIQQATMEVLMTELVK